MTNGDKLNNLTEEINEIVDICRTIDIEIPMSKPLTIEVKNKYKIKISPRIHPDNEKGFIINLKNMQEDKSLCLFDDKRIPFSSQGMSYSQKPINKYDFLKQFENIYSVPMFMEDIDEIRYRIYENRQEQLKLHLEERV